MKQDKTGQLERTNTLIQFGEDIYLKVKPIVFDGEEYDDRINLNDTITSTIKKKREKISHIDKQKEEVILKIIGQLYNGVLIPQGLSFRKGKVYKYKCQYEVGVDTIRDEVMKNIHEVAKKLTKNNLDILEYVLNKKYVNPNPHIHKNQYGNDDEKRQKIIRFPELKILELDRNDTATKKLNIHFLNGVTIEDDGDVNFFYEFKDVDGCIKTDFPSLETDTFAGLYIKFENDIKQNAEIFIQELNTEIQNSEKEIEEIKDKGQNQLALCELLNTGEDNLKNGR